VIICSYCCCSICEIYGERVFVAFAYGMLYLLSRSPSSSEEGPEQGDPLSPLFFCNTIQPLLSSLSCDLNLGYFDDVILIGPVGTVAFDVAEITKVGGAIGLALNTADRELITHQDFMVNDQLLQSVVRVDMLY